MEVEFLKTLPRIVLLGDRTQLLNTIIPVVKVFVWVRVLSCHAVAASSAPAPGLQISQDVRLQMSSISPFGL